MFGSLALIQQGRYTLGKGGRTLTHGRAWERVLSAGVQRSKIIFERLPLELRCGLALIHSDDAKVYHLEVIGAVRRSIVKGKRLSFYTGVNEPINA